MSFYILRVKLSFVYRLIGSFAAPPPLSEAGFTSSSVHDVIAIELAKAKRSM